MTRTQRTLGIGIVSLFFAAVPSALAVQAFGEGLVEIFDNTPLAMTADVGETDQTTITFSEAAAMTVVISGPAADDYTFSAFPISDNLILALAFTPGDAGNRQATLEIKDGNTVEFTIFLTGTGVGAAEIRVFDVANLTEFFDGDTLDTASEVGTPESIDLTAAGAGGLSVEIDGAAADDYTFTALTSPLDATNLLIAMSFTPSAAGPRPAVMNIVDENGAPLFSLVLAGEGLEQAAPQMRVLDADGNELPNNDSEVDLGEILKGQTAEVEVTVVNDGTAALILQGATFAGDFANATVDPTNATIQPQQEQTLTLRYTPATPGEKEGAVNLSNNSVDNPYTIGLVATVLDDCNANGEFDDEDVLNGTSEDCNFNSIPDECETDTDGDGIIDDCEEEEEITDCNFNQVDDAQDVATGTSEDCNFNGVPDECETDTDGDGIIDDCEEEEEITDCNFNQVDDAQDVADGTSADCNGNGQPDECEQDDDQDGVIDGCDRCPDFDDTADTNFNGVPDCLEFDNGACGTGTAGMMMPLMLGLMCVSCGRRRRK